MRVLVVTPWFPTASKVGAGVFVDRDVALLQKDHEVTVLHLVESRDMGSDEPVRLRLKSGALLVRHRFSPMNPASLLRASRRISQLVRTADLVHSMALHALLPVRLARPTIPWVHTEHWSAFIQELVPMKKRIGLILYRTSLSRPNAVVAVGEALSKSVGRYTRSTVSIVPNEVTLGSDDHLPEIPESRGASSLKLVAIGNLIHGKGPLETIDALGELRRRGYAATLTWIGSGPLRQAMLDRARDIGVAQEVELPGQVDSAEIPRMLVRAHVFLLPTQLETFGVAIAEALGHGLPVVSSGHGGHLDFMPCEAARVVRERTGTALADAVISLITDEQRWNPQQIVQYARDRFSEQRRRLAYLEIYEEVRR